jgi:hypothetical protein
LAIGLLANGQWNQYPIALDHRVIYPFVGSCFIAATGPLHPVFRYEPAIALQDLYRHRQAYISSPLVPQSHNGMRLQSIHPAKGL